MSIAKYATQNSRPSTSAKRDGQADLLDDLLVSVLQIGWLGLRLVLARPLLPATAIPFLYIWSRNGTPGLLVVVAIPVVLGGVWALVHPRSFRSWVWQPLRAGLRRWWRYSRQWQPVLVAHGLAVNRGQAVPMVPRLLGGARCDRWGDQLRVDLVPGLGPEDFQREATYLAHAFGALKCTITVVAPGRVALTFTTGDPLTALIPALPIPRYVDLAAVPVGATENGQPWTLPAIGTHLLIAGATGAGKGSLLWSLLRGLAPEIASGRVVAWGIDPKGGMELAFGRNLFARLADSGVEDMAQLLEDAVGVMDARTQRLKGVTRLHEPTVEEPLLLVVLDELASLTAYLNNRDVKKRVDAALQNLLTKGRAPGVVVVGALQDPRKDVITYRDLFPTRVALRLTEKEQVGMVLGDRAWDQGAHCERIPASLPGVGYVHLDGQPEPVRVRAGHVTDNDLHALNRDYPAPPSVLLVPAVTPDVIELPRPRRDRNLTAS